MGFPVKHLDAVSFVAEAPTLGVFLFSSGEKGSSGTFNPAVFLKDVAFARAEENLVEVSAFVGMYGSFSYGYF